MNSYETAQENARKARRDRIAGLSPSERLNALLYLVTDQHSPALDYVLDLIDTDREYIAKLNRMAQRPSIGLPPR